MKGYWVKTSWWVKKLLPGFVWDRPTGKKTVYLTFDDGPIPEVTPWVLHVLSQNNIKATFFCIGDNIGKHPGVFKQVVAAGHAIGNHTFNHLNGWKTGYGDYMANFEKCAASIAENGGRATQLFRPPYCKITSRQAKELRCRGYSIIMWDVLSADFDQSISPEKCLKNVVDNVTDGSIIIFHDSLKAGKNIRYALPKAIAHLRENNFEFGVLA